MRNGRFGWMVAALVAVAAAYWYRQSVTSPPAQVPIGSIVFVNGGSSGYWETIANGARAAAEVLDVDVRIVAPKDDENIEQQSKILSELDMKGVDGVAISPLDAKGQTSAINSIAEDAVVVTFDSDAPESTRDTYVGTNNLSAGQKAAALVRDALPEGGKVIVVMANLTKDNMTQRRDGFQETIDAAESSGESTTAPTFEVVDYLVDEGNADKCREVVTKALEAHADVACLVGMNSYHGPIFLKLLADQERLDKIKLVTFDDEEETLTGLEAGHIYATVVQDPYLYGYKSVERLVTVCRDIDLMRPLVKAKSTYSVNTQSLRKDDVAEFRREIKERLKDAPSK